MLPDGTERVGIEPGIGFFDMLMRDMLLWIGIDDEFP
jgi:hypothetical protein